MFELIVPKVGMGITEVEITDWKVKKGDKVIAGDEIVEITMEKASSVLVTDVTGLVEDILFEGGETVSVGSVICRIKEI